MISFLKPNLPDLNTYTKYLEHIWHTAQLTNNGTLLIELENRLKTYLGVPHLRIVSSGTTALQIAIRALELTGEIITTPFSHLSTTNALLWQHCIPKFVDIEEQTFCIDPDKIEDAITDKTSAIIATHVYGYPCNAERIGAIARKHNLKVIYDGAQAFAVTLSGQSIFNCGDVSIVSFNATKIFHTIEGGGIITNSRELDEKCSEIRYFGIRQEAPNRLGINGKNSEFHAAMGLCNLAKVDDYIAKQRDIYFLYKSLLKDLPVRFPEYKADVDYNFAYFPVIFNSKEQTERIKNKLHEMGISTKKYFSPSLNKLPYLISGSCPIAESISGRVLCLPLYYDLSLADAEKIATLIAAQLRLHNEAIYITK